MSFLQNFENIVIFTDLESDDLLAIQILINNGLFINKNILFVVDQNSNPGKIPCVLKAFIKGTIIENSDIIEGDSTKDKFPQDFYNFNLEKTEVKKY